MLVIKKRYQNKNFLIAEGVVFACFFAAMMTFMVNAIAPSNDKVARNNDQGQQDNSKQKSKEKNDEENKKTTNEDSTQNTGQGAVVVPVKSSETTDPSTAEPVVNVPEPTTSPAPKPSPTPEPTPTPTPTPSPSPTPTPEPESSPEPTPEP